MEYTLASAPGMSTIPAGSKVRPVGYPYRAGGRIVVQVQDGRGNKEYVGLEQLRPQPEVTGEPPNLRLKCVVHVRKGYDGLLVADDEDEANFVAALLGLIVANSKVKLTQAQLSKLKLAGIAVKSMKSDDCVGRCLKAKARAGKPIDDQAKAICINECKEKSMKTVAKGVGTLSYQFPDRGSAESFYREAQKLVGRESVAIGSLVVQILNADARSAVAIERLASKFGGAKKSLRTDMLAIECAFPSAAQQAKFASRFKSARLYGDKVAVEVPSEDRGVVAHAAVRCGGRVVKSVERAAPSLGDSGTICRRAPESRVMKSFSTQKMTTREATAKAMQTMPADNQCHSITTRS